MPNCINSCFAQNIYNLINPYLQQPGCHLNVKLTHRKHESVLLNQFFCCFVTSDKGCYIRGAPHSLNIHNQDAGLQYLYLISLLGNQHFTSIMTLLKTVIPQTTEVQNTLYQFFFLVYKVYRMFQAFCCAQIQIDKIKFRGLSYTVSLTWRVILYQNCKILN